MNGSPSESIPLTACCSLPVPCPLFVHYCCLAGCTHTQPQRNKTTPNENNDTPTTAAASRSSQKDNTTDQTTGLAPMSVVVASVKRIPGQHKNRISNRKKRKLSASSPFPWQCRHRTKNQKKNEILFAPRHYTTWTFCSNDRICAEQTSSTVGAMCVCVCVRIRDLPSTVALMWRVCVVRQSPPHPT